MGKQGGRGPYDFPVGIEDGEVRRRAASLLKGKGVRLPTFAELAAPDVIAEDVRSSLARIGPDEPHPRNLFRVHWFNDPRRTAQVSTPFHIELP
jgi:cysteine synthase A